jgi:anti-anti-sigma factor
MRVDIDSTRAAEGFQRVTPHGSIDAQTAPQLEQAFEPLRAGQTRVVLVDLGEVEYISSAGLQVLFGMKKALMERGGDLIFARVKPQIAKLFQIVNALPKESVFATIEEADRYFYAIMNKEIARQKETGGG